MRNVLMAKDPFALAAAHVEMQKLYAKRNSRLNPFKRITLVSAVGIPNDHVALLTTAIDLGRNFKGLLRTFKPRHERVVPYMKRGMLYVPHGEVWNSAEQKALRAYSTVVQLTHKPVVIYVAAWVFALQVNPRISPRGHPYFPCANNKTERVYCGRIFRRTHRRGWSYAAANDPIVQQAINIASTFVALHKAPNCAALE